LARTASDKSPLNTGPPREAEMRSAGLLRKSKLLLPHLCSFLFQEFSFFFFVNVSYAQFLGTVF